MSKNVSSKAVIVIDPGHGGATKIGGSSPNNAVGANGLLEKDLTLDIARRTAAILQNDAKVLLTRDADKNLSLAKRAAIAGINNASVFLSIHFNGFRDKNVDGTETFVTTKASPLSEKLARNVQDNLVGVTRASNRGVKRADLGVLMPSRHLPQTATCLAEIAFLTNPKQARQLEDAAYRQQIASALGDAILKSLPSNIPAVAPQSFSFDYEEDLDSRYFQPLDAFALGGEPVVNIQKSVGKTGDNLKEDVLAVKKRLVELGFDWITPDTNMDVETIKVIMLFQSIINGKNAVAGDGKIDVGKETHRWLQAVNAPRWQLMPAGSAAEGFHNYELTDTADKHDYGTDWLAYTVRAIAAHYRDNYLKTNPNAPLFTINDVSLERGGDTRAHSGHETGLNCDIRLPKTDGTAGRATYRDAAYDRNTARAMLQAIKAQSNVSVVYFNDSVLAGEGLCRTESSWCSQANMKCHDNHIHFEIKPPARGAVELDGKFNYHSGGMLYQGSHQDDIDYRTYALDCGNSTKIEPDETRIEFAKMGTLSKRANKKENVFLRWNIIQPKTCEIDIVVHFHGFNITGQSNFFDFVVKNSGLDLKDRKPPTLCILPFGKHEPNYKQKENGKWVDKVNNDRYVFPFLETDGGLQELIDESLKSLKGTFNVRRLILVAHSGGGRAVANILRRKVNGTLKLKKANGDIDEVHLFDATYSGASDFINWAEKRIQFDAKPDKSELETKGGGLRVLYLPSSARAGTCVKTGTTDGAQTIERKLIDLTKGKEYLRRCFRVEAINITHLEIPNIFGGQLLKNGFANLKVLQEHSSFINACCKNDPRCGIKQATQQSLAYYEDEEPDYFAASEADYMNY